MSAAPRSGHCLCGAVAYRTTGPLEPVLHCHCENCRRITGNFVAASHVDDADLIIEGADHLRWHDLSFARYGFCGECGSTLFFKATAVDGVTSVMAGTLDDAGGLPLAGVWFAADVQEHNLLPPDVPHFAGNDGG